MKKVFIILMTALLLSPSAQAYTFKKRSTSKRSELKIKLEAIELIDGEPKNKKYKTLGPVMGMCTWSTAMSCAVKKMKKEAIKLGADAIIKVEMGTSTQTSAGYGGGVFAAGSGDVPTVKGWAVEWEE